MNNDDIENEVRRYNYVLPVQLYIDICRSSQVDHVKKDGEWIDIWTKDARYWRVKIKNGEE